MSSLDEEEIEQSRGESDSGPYEEEDYRTAIRVIRDVLIDRDVLYDAVARDYLGEVFTQQSGEAFAADAERALGWSTGAKAIRITVQHHVGSVMTEKLLRRICWQISANEEVLKRGNYLSPSLSDCSRRWMIVDISGVDLAPSTAYATLIIRALAGRAAGWSMRQDITEGHSYFIAGKLGFRGGHRREWYQYDGDVAKLYGLYFAANLEDGRVSRFACTGPLLELNRKIIRMRYRGAISEDGIATDNWGNPISLSRLPYGCPIGLAHSCQECPRKRHVVTRSDGHKPAADSCGAAY